MNIFLTPLYHLLALTIKEAQMIQLSDSARDEIAQSVKKLEEKKAVRVYIAGHG